MKNDSENYSVWSGKCYATKIKDVKNSIKYTIEKTIKCTGDVQYFVNIRRGYTFLIFFKMLECLEYIELVIIIGIFKSLRNILILFELQYK